MDSVFSKGIWKSPLPISLHWSRYQKEFKWKRRECKHEAADATLQIASVIPYLKLQLNCCSFLLSPEKMLFQTKSIRSNLEQALHFLSVNKITSYFKTYSGSLRNKKRHLNLLIFLLWIRRQSVEAGIVLSGKAPWFSYIWKYFNLLSFFIFF